MWFPERIREVAEVDVAPAVRALENLDESVWFADEDLKKKLAGDRPTQSLFFYSMTKEEYVATLASRPIKQEDVKTFDAYALLYEDFRYLFEAIQQYYPPGGVFLRAQAARMPPGGKIKEHRDNLIILENTHRLHIPIVTTPKIKFMVDNERVVLEAGHIYELNNQLNHWVENPKNSINRTHLILDYLPPEYNIPESSDEKFKFYIREHRLGRAPKAADVAIDLPKVVATVAIPAGGVAYRHELHELDFEAKTTRRVFEWQELPAAASSIDLSTAPYGVSVTDKAVIVARNDELYFFDRSFVHKATYHTPFLKNARKIVCDGRSVYVVSRGTDSIVRFDLRKKIFDSAWRLYVDGAGKIAIQKFAPEKDEAPGASSIFGLSGVAISGKDMLVSGEQLTNLIHIEDGRVESGQQVPAKTSDILSFGKGVAFASPDMQQVVYIADYDYRTVRSSAVNAHANFSTGLCKYQKGTLLVGTQPAGVALLDMKNQAVASYLPLGDDDGSIVLGLDLIK